MLEWIQFWNMSQTSLAEVVEHQREAQCFDQVFSSLGQKSQRSFGKLHKASTKAEYAWPNIAKRLECVQFWNLSQTSLVEVLELRREAQSFTAKLRTIDKNDFQAKFGKEPKLEKIGLAQISQLKILESGTWLGSNISAEDSEVWNLSQTSLPIFVQNLLFFNLPPHPPITCADAQPSAACTATLAAIHCLPHASSTQQRCPRFSHSPHHVAPQLSVIYAPFLLSVHPPHLLVAYIQHSGKAHYPVNDDHTPWASCQDSASSHHILASNHLKTPSSSPPQECTSSHLNPAQVIKTHQDFFLLCPVLAQDEKSPQVQETFCSKSKMLVASSTLHAQHVKNPTAAAP
ncbi:hypothetical protein C8J57DRAFT_1245533 [Mycena rebaudengoi]|nr:hypothetical protein C8J57DRAFT_1245533 [Mycena rebaudengoi]